MATRRKPLRIRMYRVGFGDFFLVTVPSPDGPQHILIDCGVTKGKTGKGDIHTIKSAVTHMAEETKGHLALIIATHRHMDHIIGFSRCEDVFTKFTVDAIWMPLWETEYVDDIVKFQAELTAVALDVQSQLAAGSDDPDPNVLGILRTPRACRRQRAPAGDNAKSLNLLKTKLGVKPQYLYKGHAKTPAALRRRSQATILGPPRLALEFMRLTDLGKVSDGRCGRRRRRGNPEAPFTGLKVDRLGIRFGVSMGSAEPTRAPDWTRRYDERVEEVISQAQPTALVTAAKRLDDFLNNQSLVVLFTWNDKSLLFAGDAQAGNWEYWLYDLDTPSKTTTGVTPSPEGASILANLDFYKVGHHGSTNATPIAAVAAMGTGFAAMCSTQADSFGSVQNNSEVPRGPLLDALEKKCALVRSDQIAVELDGLTVPPAEDVPQEVPKPQRGRYEVGSCYVDYLL